MCRKFSYSEQFLTSIVIIIIIIIININTIIILIQIPLYNRKFIVKSQINEKWVRDLFSHFIFFCTVLIFKASNLTLIFALNDKVKTY